MLYVKRIHQDWKKKWGLKLCGYLFWNKTIFDNLIILVVKPGWIVHAKYVFFFCFLFFFFVINSKSICNDAHKFSANTAETALFNFLDCWHQHLLLLSTFSDATSLWPIPASRLSFFFSLPSTLCIPRVLINNLPGQISKEISRHHQIKLANQHFVSTFWMLKFRVLRHDYNLSFTPYLHPRNLWRAGSQATQD